ncbi:MAG: DDE-type integrase/transposase/recombinase [Novosphingobium sp.]
MSERRACSAFPINRSTQRYQSRCLDQAGLKLKIRELAATRVRYGYRRIHGLLRRGGWEINHKRTHSLYREVGLQLRNKTPKRKVKAKLRDDRTAASAPNECWSIDFLSDQLFDGRRIRILSIIDNFSRVSSALDVTMSYRSADLVETLERVAATHGRPKRIRLDNGPEFISKDLDLWAWSHGVVLDFSRPGKPTDTFAESFNGRVRGMPALTQKIAGFSHKDRAKDGGRFNRGQDYHSLWATQRGADQVNQLRQRGLPRCPRPERAAGRPCQ